MKSVDEGKAGKYRRPIEPQLGDMDGEIVNKSDVEVCEGRKNIICISPHKSGIPPVDR